MIPENETPEETRGRLQKIKNVTQSLPKEWRGKEVVAEVSSAVPTYMPGQILYLEKIRDFGRKYIESIEDETSHAREPTRDRANASLNLLKKHISAGIEHGIETVKRQVQKKDRKYVYVPRWADRDEFQQIIVSTSMITDHLPFKVLKQFEESPFGVGLRTTM